MFDLSDLHPSHQPMRAAADLANASVCLRAAEGFLASAAKALAAAYGLPCDENMGDSIRVLAASLDALRAQIIDMEGA